MSSLGNLGTIGLYNLKKQMLQSFFHKLEIACEGRISEFAGGRVPTCGSVTNGATSSRFRMFHSLFTDYVSPSPETYQEEGESLLDHSTTECQKENSKS